MSEGILPKTKIQSINFLTDPLPLPSLSNNLSDYHLRTLIFYIFTRFLAMGWDSNFIQINLT